VNREPWPWWLWLGIGVCLAWTGGVVALVMWAMR